MDVGFPLPAILPARPGRTATAQGELEVAATARGFRVIFLEGVPETPRQIEIHVAPVAQERFAVLWRQTSGQNSRLLGDVCLRRDLGNRVVSFAAGEVRVDDLHSRLCVPLPAPHEAALSELFGIDAAILSGAFAEVADVVGDAGENARLTAYLETDAGPERAFAAIATQEGYRRLLAGVADVTVVQETPEGYRLALSAPTP